MSRKGKRVLPELESDLLTFCTEYDADLTYHGTTLAMLYVTRLARTSPAPLSAELLICRSGGQIAGLSAQRVHTILEEYGREDEWLGEAGRTNMSNCGRAIAYANILNQWHGSPAIDFTEVERWWLARLPTKLIKPPYHLHVRPSRTVDALIQTWMQPIAKLERDHPNHELLKTVFASLFGATFFSDPESKTARKLTVTIGFGERRDILVTGTNMAVLVSDFPSQSCLTSCRSALEQRKAVYIVVSEQVLQGARYAVSANRLHDRVEVLSIEQVLASKLVQLQLNDGHTQKSAWAQIVNDANAWLRKLNDREVVRFDIV